MKQKKVGTVLTQTEILAVRGLGFVVNQNWSPEFALVKWGNFRNRAFALVRKSDLFLLLGEFVK